MAASITPGYAFASTEQVTAAKLATLVSGSTITGLTNTEIASDAAIAYSKINVTAAAINYDRLNLTGGIVNADVSASAAIVDTKLAQITTASKVSGTAITGLASLPEAAGVIPLANLPTPTADTNTSNVLFQYSASTTLTAAGKGEIAGTDLIPTTATGGYRFLSSRDAGSSAYVTVWTSKWKKIAGISTITVYGEIWVNGGVNSAMLKVDVGGANGSVTGTSGQLTPEWKTFTIDVSGLSNGTVYTVTVQLAHDEAAARNAFLGNLISFGS